MYKRPTTSFLFKNKDFIDCANHRRALELVFVILVLALPSQVYAQRTVLVEPSSFGALNIAIDSDTTASGARVDSNTVYVLRRGATYLLNGSVENRGYPLRIVAEDGDGARPILQPGVDITGAASRAFRLRGDFYLRDVYVTHINDIGSLQSNMFRISADDVRIEIENCYLDYEAQSFFRIDSEGIKLYVRNTVARNSGLAASPGNGRIIDTRGNAVDTLYVENNTFYNLTNQVLLTGLGSGGVMNYVKFNHNTMYNIGNTAIGLNRSIEAEVTNNIIMNAGFLGDPVESQSEEPLFEAIISIDSLGVPELSEADRRIIIRNNNIFLDPAYEALIDAADSVEVMPLFTAKDSLFINAGTAVVSGNVSENIVFSDGPGLVTTYAADRFANPANENPPDFADDDDGPTTLGPGNRVFSYADTFVSNSSSQSGQPLGDLNWFGLDIIEVANEQNASIPAGFTLLGNYPNPFNPTTHVIFEITEPLEITLQVYDVLGRTVLSMPAQFFAAPGQHQIQINAGDLSSGIYLYRLASVRGAGGENGSRMGRMLLVK